MFNSLGFSVPTPGEVVATSVDHKTSEQMGKE